MLNTEQRNPHTTHIDRMSTAEMLSVIQAENKRAVNAIDTELAAIGSAVDAITARMQQGAVCFTSVAVLRGVLVCWMRRNVPLPTVPRTIW